MRKSILPQANQRSNQRNGNYNPMPQATFHSPNQSQNSNSTNNNATNQGNYNQFAQNNNVSSQSIPVSQMPNMQGGFQNPMAGNPMMGMLGNMINGGMNNGQGSSLNQGMLGALLQNSPNSSWNMIESIIPYVNPNMRNMARQSQHASNVMGAASSNDPVGSLRAMGNNQNLMGNIFNGPLGMLLSMRSGMSGGVNPLSMLSQFGGFGNMGGR